jgi:hypothetical protein
MPVVRTDGSGNVRRGEGANNFGYGVRPGAKPSILNVHARGAHGRKPYPCRNHDADYVLLHLRDPEKRVMLEAMTRDELRAVCKAQNVIGYGKMNKAQLVEAALV